MDNNTFGSHEKYPTLKYLVEKINEMDDKDKAYISSFIQDFNGMIKNCEDIENIDFKKYVLDLIYQDTKNKINHFIVDKHDKYDKNISSYLKNYVHAKIKNMKYEKI